MTIPSGSLVDAFGSTDTFSPVPLISGTNKDEMKLFLALDPRLINRYFGVLITPKKKNSTMPCLTTKAVSGVFARLMMRRARWLMLATIRSTVIVLTGTRADDF